MLFNRPQAALPLLLKDPEGHVYRNTDSARDDAGRVYHFPPIPGTDLSFPPWVELQYPHVKRRIHLDAQGRWRATE